jgi:excisionase family DNA binding protein
MSFTKSIQEQDGLAREDRFLTVAEVASRTGLSPAAVYRQIRQGHLRAYNLCGRLRIRPAALEDWIAARAVPARPIADAAPGAESPPLVGRGQLRPLLEAERAA